MLQKQLKNGEKHVRKGGKTLYGRSLIFISFYEHYIYIEGTASKYGIKDPSGTYCDFVIWQRRSDHGDLFDYESYTCFLCSKTRPFLDTALADLNRMFLNAFRVIKPCTLFYVH